MSVPGHPKPAAPGGHTIRRVAIIPLALATLLLLTAAAPATARSLLLGVSTDGYGRDMGMLQDHYDRVGEWPALWSIWSQWGDRGGNSGCQPGAGTCAFPEQTLQALAAKDPGIIPVIWWEPWRPGKDISFQGKWARYKRILSGKHDKYIKDWARAARDHGGRIILRFAHEANGDWFPWGIGNFDNNTTNFKKAWRYVWRQFQNVGATNVEFLWSVTRQDCRRCNPFMQVFPGNKWVDWAGITAFNWGAKKSWKSMIQILERPVGEMRKVTKKKILVSELASHYRPTTKSKANWIRNGYQKTHARWPFIKAVMYLDSVGPKIQHNHPDWRLIKPNDMSAMQAYADIAAMSKFQGNLPNP
jgi:hypothetical protein